MDQPYWVQICCTYSPGGIGYLGLDTVRVYQERTRFKELGHFFIYVYKKKSYQSHFWWKKHDWPYTFTNPENTFVLRFCTYGWENFFFFVFYLSVHKFFVSFYLLFISSLKFDLLRFKNKLSWYKKYRKLK